MSDFLKFFPLLKVDERTHTITGCSTAEEPDKDDELCDYDWAKKDYQRWAKEASESTKAAGQEVSYGNIRLQHASEIAGKVNAPIIFDDKTKSVHLQTEPIDDDIWAKAQKGFIRGFSQGGGYLWRKCNECWKTAKMAATDIAKGNTCPKCKKHVVVRYAPEISEVSYVDNPCLKAATFSLVKADGSTELHKFQNEQEGSSATMEPTPAGTPAPLEPSLSDLVNKAVRKELASKENLRKQRTQPTAERAARLFARVQDIAADESLAKGMYSVSRFADLLASLASLQASALYERDAEDDESAVPDDLLADLEALIETFLAMAEEEAHELTAPGGERAMYMSQEVTDLAKAARKTLASHFTKAAAHHEKLAAHHGDMHKAHSDRAEASKDENKSVASFHKAMATSHEKCKKAHEAHAEHLKKMAEAQAEEPAQKSAEPQGLAKTAAPEPPAAATTEHAAGDPGAAVQNTMQQMMSESFISMFKGTLDSMKDSSEVKKMISEAVVAQMAETLGKQIQPDGTKLAGPQLVARPGEAMFKAAEAEDINDTGL